MRKFIVSCVNVSLVALFLNGTVLSAMEMDGRPTIDSLIEETQAGNLGLVHLGVYSRMLEGNLTIHEMDQLRTELNQVQDDNKGNKKECLILLDKQLDNKCQEDAHKG